MGMVYSKISPGAQTSTYEFALTAAQRVASVHQVTVEFAVGTTGTCALYARANGRTTYEPVTENGVQIVFDSSDPRTARVWGDISDIKLVPANITGGESYTPYFSGWEG